MSRINEILKAAEERAQTLKLPYVGALLPAEAAELMAGIPGARLVDVRTRAELEWVGRVPGAVEIEWLSWPGSQLNPNFLNQLKAQVDPESVVMFLCRSGTRSHHAAGAAANAGFTAAYNVLQGFEGDRDAQGHRNSLGGWRAAGLPWSQG